MPKIQTEPNPGFKELIDRGGVLVTKAIFRHSVNNGHGTPETQFSMKSAHASRNIEGMWYTHQGLVCKHLGAFFIVPLHNVIAAYEE